MSHKIVEHFQDPTICDQLKDKILATPSGVPTAGIESVAFESAKKRQPSLPLHRLEHVIVFINIFIDMCMKY